MTRSLSLSPSELSALVRLVDDPSPRVRTKVAARLRALGADAVEDALEDVGLSLSTSQRQALDEALRPDLIERNEDAVAALRAGWNALLGERDEMRFLERALVALSSWMQGDPTICLRLPGALDDLADEFRVLGEPSEASALAEFLFGSERLRGVATARFYDAHNSDLAWVIERGEGLPISLACVFILVGARLGIAIEGCNFPGHFLARDAHSGRVFDPYNGGRELSLREVQALRGAAPIEMDEGASTRQIVARVLRNLSVAFHHAQASQETALMLRLLRDLEDDR